jgi:hypothetical protein
MCGSTEINGYTFCSGLSKLELSYKDHPGLKSLIRPMTYLIKGAIFRPKYATLQSSGLSLGELIDMYYTREATIRHDKVYALLSMSSDGLDKVSLLPDYMVPWNTLLQRLLESILSTEVSIDTWDKREIAVIKSKGYILGHVSAVSMDSTQYDRQHVEFIFNDAPKSAEYRKEYGYRWNLQASAMPIQTRDVICFLQGASKPTIIRPCKDHFAVIMIAVTPWQHGKMGSGSSEHQELLVLAKNFLHDLLLVWNWEKSPDALQDRARYETSGEIDTLVPEYLEIASNKAARFYDVTLALRDSKDYEEAGNRFQEIIEGSISALGKVIPHTLAHMDELAMIYKNQQSWQKAEDLILQVIDTRKRLQGIDHQDTLNSTAILASIYIDQSPSIISTTEDQEMMASLPNQIRHNIQIRANVVRIMKRSGKKMLPLLLGLKEDNVLVTEEAVKAAAEDDYQGEEIMTLLLDQRGNKIKITEEVLIEAAWSKTTKVMELLLDRRGDEVKMTEKVLEAAARSKHQNMMKLLLDRRGDEIEITERVVASAATVRIWKNSVVMELLLDRRGDEVRITEEVVKAAAGNNHIHVMKLLLDQRGNEVKITEEVIKEAARNFYGNVMQLLLNRRGSEVKITEEVVKRAAGNHFTEVMELLLDRRGDEVRITEEVVKAAAGNSKMMRLLRDRRGDEVGIHEAVAKQQ